VNGVWQAAETNPPCPSLLAFLLLATPVELVGSTTIASSGIDRSPRGQVDDPFKAERSN